MTAAPHVIAVPLAMGGRGSNEVRDYYVRHFIGRTPQDIRLEPLSRTVDAERVVDEMVVSFAQFRRQFDGCPFDDRGQLAAQ